MSFSFNVRGVERDAIKAEIETKMDEVVKSQSIHVKDRDNAISVALMALDTVVDVREGEQFSVSVSGSMGWRGQMNDSPEITSANLSASATILAITS